MATLRCLFAKLAALVCTFCLFAIGAHAQSLSSFNITGQFSDVTITSSDLLNFEVELGPNPSFVYGNATYVVTDVIGFWVLSDTMDLNAVNDDFVSGGRSWKAKNNDAGVGSIAGWRAANANAGLEPNESESFSFASLSPSSGITGYGFHVRVEGQFPTGGGNTGHIRYTPVPEPTTFVALGAAAYIFLRRRRR